MCSSVYRRIKYMYELECVWFKLQAPGRVRLFYSGINAGTYVLFRF